MSNLTRPIARKSARHVALLSAVILVALQPAVAENWPQWRGPRGNSTSTETGLPVVWNDQANIAWKTPLPGWGSSTPAIWRDDVFVTTQHDDGLLVLKLDRRSGKIVWQREVGTAATPRTGPKRDKQVFHQLHNLASPSPVTDGETVVVHFGNGDLAAYDFAGEQRWHRNLQADHGAYTIWWGRANSPVLFGDTVISVCMQDSLSDVADEPAQSYLVAHELDSGRVRWQTARMTDAPAEQADAYTTPVLVDNGGRTELIVMGANHLDAYDPSDGRRLWVVPQLIGGRTVTGPTVAGGMLYVTRGMRGSLLGFKLDPAAPDRAPEIAWKHSQGTPDTPCPVVWNEVLFTITDNGIARAYDAINGKLHWTERLHGDYKASPLAAEGRIYFLNTDGLCTVVSASTRFEVLAKNELPDTTLASPAVSDRHLFLRGRDALYCLGESF